MNSVTGSQYVEIVREKSDSDISLAGYSIIVAETSTSKRLKEHLCISTAIDLGRYSTLSENFSNNIFDFGRESLNFIILLLSVAVPIYRISS